MKKLTCLFFMLIMSLPIEGRLYSQGTAPSMAQAESVLNNYFNLLRSGNTSAILNLLTGSLLKKREGLLRDNPEYGKFLRERYKNAQLFVTGQELNNKRLALDVLIVFDNQEELETRLTFVMEGGRVKISKEKDPAEDENDTE